MGKDHHVDERRPTTDMVCRMRKVGAYHYRSLCLSPDRARNMLERKACICFFHLQCQEVAQKCLLSSEFLAWFLVNNDLERSKPMEERFLILLKMSPLCLASWLQQISSSPGTMSSSGGNPCLCAVPAYVSSPVLTQGQLAMAEQCVVKGRSGRSLPQSEIFFFLLSFGQP